MAALTGMVRTHAQRMRVVTPQRTALTRWLAPAPMMQPVITCVVDTGRPRDVAVSVMRTGLYAIGPLSVLPMFGDSSVLFTARAMRDVPPNRVAFLSRADDQREHVLQCHQEALTLAAELGPLLLPASVRTPGSFTMTTG